MFNEAKWVWMNGKMIPWQDAMVHVSAHGLHYGTGVFEGIRCYETAVRPAVFRLKDHLDRLYASAAVYGMNISYTQHELQEVILEVIRKNDFRNCYIRPICFYGSGSLSVHPRQCPVDTAILAWPWANYVNDTGIEKGIRVMISSWRKFHSRMMPTTAKACGGYINSVLGVREAVARDYDEAVLLDESGFVAEGSGENLFMVKENTIVTNDEKSSILLGITRDAIIRIARDFGYQVRIQAIRADNLYGADEVFLTGTAAEVTPVCKVDGKTINHGRRGPITEKIQSTYFAATRGREARYREWLHFID